MPIVMTVRPKGASLFQHIGQFNCPNLTHEAALQHIQSHLTKPISVSFPSPAEEGMPPLRNVLLIKDDRTGNIYKFLAIRTNFKFNRADRAVNRPLPVKNKKGG